MKSSPQPPEPPPPQDGGGERPAPPVPKPWPLRWVVLALLAYAVFHTAWLLLANRP